jgi:hypothetical protein
MGNIPECGMRTKSGGNGSRLILMKFWCRYETLEKHKLKRSELNKCCLQNCFRLWYNCEVIRILKGQNSTKSLVKKVSASVEAVPHNAASHRTQFPSMY